MNIFFEKKFRFKINNEKKRPVVLLIFLFLSFHGFSQTQRIKGTVSDSNGKTLPGATINSAKTSDIGATTDANGLFTLNVSEGTMLKVSFLGYETQIVTAKNDMKVIMRESSEVMGEVVVIGYGTSKKKDLTGAVTSLTAKSFIDQPSSSANSILTGRAPGVSVRKMSGSPGEGSTIRIRGANSIYGDNSPLIVVDGNYSTMPDANDIESIEILKDASATAIYGSRGANGVILVTTKRGKTGKPSIRLNSNLSVNNMNQRYDLMDAYEFAKYHKEAGDYPFTDEEIAKFKANPAGTNWQDEIFRTGYAKTNKIIITGGSENVNYYISPYYNKTTGVLKNSEAGSYGLLTKTDVRFDKRVSLQIELDGTHSDNVNREYASGGSNTGLPLMAAMMWSPTEPVYDNDGQLNQFGVGTGTLLSPRLLLSPDQTEYRNAIRSAANLKIKIIDGLELNAKGTVDIGAGGARDFYSARYTTISAKAEQTSFEDKSWLVNTYLNYNKTFALRHNLSAMVGFEESESTTQNLSGTANQLPTESVGWYNLGLAAPNIQVGSGWGNQALRSYFGRVNYNYDSRYYVTVSTRADGSSKFRDGNQYGYFPSFSLAWRVSEEKFMKNQHLFQNLKLRGGWGVTGSQAVSPYATYSTLRSKGYTWGTSSALAGYFPIVGGNPDLKWESTKQVNLGLDFAIIDNRVSVSLDYYNKKTVDLLAPVSVPGYAGGVAQYGEKSIISNVGSVRNEGFEFNVNWDVVQKKSFSYDLNLNGAFNRNKVLDLGETPMLFGRSYGGSSVSPFALIPGQAIGTIYGLKYLGIWQEKEAADAAKFGQVPGDYKYEDLNGNNNYDADDYQVLGNTNPKFTWGFNNHLSYKNLDVNILIEGSQKRDVLNATRMMTIERNMFTNREALNRWDPQHPDAEFAKRTPTNRFNSLSSQYMEDASYVKLRNISVSYRFTRKLIPFADLQLFVSGQNLLTFTKYKGYDPEINSSVGDDANSGMDWFAYPNPRSFSFGLTVTY